MSLTFTDEQYNSMAIKAIRNYKNFPFEITDEEITIQFSEAIPVIINNLQESFKMSSLIKEDRQGDRDTTYRDNISPIDNNVILLIGYPYLIMHS